MNHIILIGFMGCGKTSVGSRLAKDMGLPFVDMDDLIREEASMEITEIFHRYGERYFRRLETQTLRRLGESSKRMVISAGGGMPVEPENQPILRGMGTVVLLEASVETLAKRLQDSGNFHGGENVPERIKKLLAVRGPIYEKMADLEVVTGEKPFDDLIDEIEKKLENCEKTVEKNQ